MLCDRKISVGFSLLFDYLESVQAGLLILSVFRVHKWHHDKHFLIEFIILPDIWVAIDFLGNAQRDLVERESLWSTSEYVS